MSVIISEFLLDWTWKSEVIDKSGQNEASSDNLDQQDKILAQ